MAEDAERSCVERKMLPFEHRRADPSRGQDAPELAMREQRDVPLKSAKASDEPIGALEIWSADSPCGQPSRKMFQPGRSLQMSSERSPS